MKIYIMTDLEGVAGITDFENWCMPESRYYETARELLTQEVNAAIKGFSEGGVTEIVVADGHGPGGINPVLLENRAQLMRGWPTGYPLGIDSSYDAIAWVGQHAKAGTAFAHLAHTQSFGMLDYSINGLSIGEFGQTALAALELGVPPIFGSGDLAFTKEASALFPSIEAVRVKYGTTPGAGTDCTADEYRVRNKAAVHLHPDKAREAIREGALRAIRRMPAAAMPIRPIYEAVVKRRADENNPPSTKTFSHPSSISQLINDSFGIKGPKK